MSVKNKFRQLDDSFSSDIVEDNNIILKSKSSILLGEDIEADSSLFLPTISPSFSILENQNFATEDIDLLSIPLERIFDCSYYSQNFIILCEPNILNSRLYELTAFLDIIAGRDLKNNTVELISSQFIFNQAYTEINFIMNGSRLELSLIFNKFFNYFKNWKMDHLVQMDKDIRGYRLNLIAKYPLKLDQSSNVKNLKVKKHEV